MLDLCAAALQWRWLFLDEISMVSAELLARVELRCREMVRDLSERKYGTANAPRPFGGLNVVLSGDLWQLPPPRGTFLGRSALGNDHKGREQEIGFNSAGTGTDMGRGGKRNTRRNRVDEMRKDPG